MDYEKLVHQIREELISEQLIQVETSARHVHLSKAHIKQLFGENYELTQVRELSQPGQFLCQERVTLCGPKGKFEKVAILGPARENTQVEISKTDTFALGVSAPIKQSGDIKGTAGITIIGPMGTVVCEEGLMIAQRHIHIEPDVAQKMGLVDNQIVSVDVLTDRGVVFKDVVVRVHQNFRSRMHIDQDEANASSVQGFTLGRIRV